MKDTKTIYEQLGGTYREENGSLVPDVELPEQKPIGKYGKMHLDYLKKQRRGRYSALLGEGRLNTYLSGIDEQAHEMLNTLIVEIAKRQGIDEHLKATDQIRWVQMMNNEKSEGCFYRMIRDDPLKSTHSVFSGSISPPIIFFARSVSI